MRRHTFIVFMPSAGINIAGSGALRLSLTSVKRLELAKSLERLDFFFRILIPIVRNTPLIWWLATIFLLSRLCLGSAALLRIN